MKVDEFWKNWVLLPDELKLFRLLDGNQIEELKL